ncbi:MAG TPA: hypothetical protein VGQ83_21990, partial [Polyangia bacterium]
MANRDWDTELDFSPDELADMGAEILNRAARVPAAVPPEPTARRRVALRVPGDSVPRVPAAEPAAPSASDAAVEQAFASAQRADEPIDIDDADVIMDQAEALAAPTPGPPVPATTVVT